jgi:hypothetical protein
VCQKKLTAGDAAKGNDFAVPSHGLCVIARKGFQAALIEKKIFPNAEGKGT